MPSPIDVRRLRDAAHALTISNHPPQDLAEARSQLEIVSAGLAAIQSLDDLGPEANAHALGAEQELMFRMEDLGALVVRLEEAATP